MTNKNNETIWFCRYYKGEKECPEHLRGTDEGLFWFYECRWAEMYNENSQILESHIEEFLLTPGLSSFEAEDGTPTSLKALLFNRFAVGCYTMAGAVPGFKKWYKEVYQSSCIAYQLT